MVELIGILATLLVLVSFLFTGETKIRVINIIGAVIFVIYGVLINSLSVWILNGALIIIHFVKLYKYKKENEYGKNKDSIRK